MYKDMTIVGKGIPLKEGYSKVTGMLKFTPDRGVPGQLWMKILRSPHPHAKIKSIDTSKAEASPGIEAVIAHKDVPQKEIICPILNWRGGVLEDRVRYVGDEVAAVAGQTEEAAEKALDLIEVEYERLPTVFDIEEALKPDAPDVKGTGSNETRCPPSVSAFASFHEWGDIKEGFEQADATIEAEVRTGSVYTSFCPPACIAEWEGDKLTLTLAHQFPYQMRALTSDVLDIPQHKVRIIAPMIAGSFGMLNSPGRFWFLAALLSKKTSKPVVYKMTIEEYGVYKRREINLMRVRMGGKKDGTVTALDYEQLHDNGGYGARCVTKSAIHDIFSRANVRYDAWGVNNNRPSTGCVRGVGSVPQVIGVNQAVDMLAEKLGLDPLTIWKKNHHKAGDPRRSLVIPGLTLSSEAYDELIDKGANAIEWEKKWKGWGKPYEVIGPKKRGVGMAVANHFSGITAMPASATVQINRDGTAQVLIGSMDLGTGSKTTFAQICAEVLGLRIEDVYVVRDVDTETIPYMCYTGASCSLHLGGSAIKIAAIDAKRQILEMAYATEWSPGMGYAAEWSPESLERFKKGVKKPEDLDIKDGMVYVKVDPSRCVSVKQIVSPLSTPTVIGRAARHDLPVPGPTAYITLAGFADVEVDTETGKVNVLKLVQCDDSGRIINPEVCENQVYGGTLQSFGYGLMEDIAFDPVTGQVLNPALSDYWTPTSLDAPPMDVIFSDNIDPVGPLGAKGIGEASTICPHAAIVSAIYNAISVRISQLPVTPDKVLKALGKIKKSGLE